MALDYIRGLIKFPYENKNFNLDLAYYKLFLYHLIIFIQYYCHDYVYL